MEALILFPFLIIAASVAAGAISLLSLALPPKRARTVVVISTVVMATGVLAIGMSSIMRMASQRQAMSAAATMAPDKKGMAIALDEEERVVRFRVGALIGIPALLSGALCLVIQLRRLNAQP